MTVLTAWEAIHTRWKILAVSARVRVEGYTVATGRAGVLASVGSIMMRGLVSESNDGA